MKVPRTLNMPPSVETTRQTVELFGRVLSGNVSFGATTSNTDKDINISCWKATGTTPGVANTTFTVSHNLKHIPWGFFVVRLNAAAIIFDSGVAWTAATNAAQGTISLQCNQATVAFTLIII